MNKRRAIIFTFLWFLLPSILFCGQRRNLVYTQKATDKNDMAVVPYKGENYDVQRYTATDLSDDVLHYALGYAVLKPQDFAKLNLVCKKFDDALHCYDERETKKKNFLQRFFSKITFRLQWIPIFRAKPNEGSLKAFVNLFGTHEQALEVACKTGNKSLFDYCFAILAEKHKNEEEALKDTQVMSTIALYGHTKLARHIIKKFFYDMPIEHFFEEYGGYDEYIHSFYENGRETLLYSAAEEENIRAVEDLLEQGASTDVFIDSSSLLIAVQKKNIKIIKILLAAGADPDQRTHHCVASYEVAQRSSDQVVRELVKPQIFFIKHPSIVTCFFISMLPLAILVKSLL